MGGGASRAGYCTSLPHLVPTRALSQPLVSPMEGPPWSRHYPEHAATCETWCRSLFLTQSGVRDETHSHKTVARHIRQRKVLVLNSAASTGICSAEGHLGLGWSQKPSWRTWRCEAGRAAWRTGGQSGQRMAGREKCHSENKCVSFKEE